MSDHSRIYIFIVHTLFCSGLLRHGLRHQQCPQGHLQGGQAVPHGQINAREVCSRQLPHLHDRVRPIPVHHGA